MEQEQSRSLKNVMLLFSRAKVVPDPESTPTGFCGFPSDPESKICEKLDPVSLFNFGRSRSLCDNFLSKKMGKLQLER